MFVNLSASDVSVQNSMKNSRDNDATQRTAKRQWCLLDVFSHFWLRVCAVILAQMQYSFLSQSKCVFDLVIIKHCTRGVCVHRWHGLDFLQNIPGQPDDQMNHVASPQTADPQLQHVLHMWQKHLDPSLLTKIWQLLFSWHYGIADCLDLPLFTHQSLHFTDVWITLCWCASSQTDFVAFRCTMSKSLQLPNFQTSPSLLIKDTLKTIFLSSTL